MTYGVLHALCLTITLSVAGVVLPDHRAVLFIVAACNALAAVLAAVIDRSNNRVHARALAHGHDRP